MQTHDNPKQLMSHTNISSYKHFNTKQIISHNCSLTLKVTKDYYANPPILFLQMPHVDTLIFLL